MYFKTGREQRNCGISILRLGWHIRIRYNKRVIVYCIPCDQYFVILLVLGEKAVGEAMESSISAHTKQLIHEAAAHTEGRSCYT